MIPINCNLNSPSLHLSLCQFYSLFQLERSLCLSLGLFAGCWVVNAGCCVLHAIASLEFLFGLISYQVPESQSFEDTADMKHGNRQN